MLVVSLRKKTPWTSPLMRILARTWALEGLFMGLSLPSTSTVGWAERAEGVALEINQGEGDGRGAGI